MSKSLEAQLEELENCFLQNGYTREMIEEIKIQNEAVTTSDFIDNLQSEQGYWDC